MLVAFLFMQRILLCFLMFLLGAISMACSVGGGGSESSDLPASAGLSILGREHFNEVFLLNMSVSEDSTSFVFDPDSQLTEGFFLVSVVDQDQKPLTGLERTEFYFLEDNERTSPATYTVKETSTQGTYRITYISAA